MLSIARSRYTLATQFLFLATNALGLALGVSYNANTPDLYPNNAHHKIGWIATWIVSAQVLISVAGRVAGVMSRDAAKRNGNQEEQAFIPVSTENMAEHDAILGKFRHSDDSGHGTERNTESLRDNSLSASGQDSPSHGHEQMADYIEDEDLELKEFELSTPKNKAHSLIAKAAGKISSRAWKVLLFGYNVVDRTILVLGYVALATGIVTMARFFVGSYNDVFREI
jgi:hypothetical protein